MSFTASDLVPANDPVAVSGIQLWEPVAVFLPDWGQPPTMEERYRTTVLSSRSVAETRYGLAQKPQRTQRVTLRSLQADDRQRLAAQLTRMSRSRFPFPVYSDRAKLSGKPSMDSFEYSGDFTNRRFQAGGWAVAVDDDGTATAADFQFRKIVNVSDSLIELDGDLKETYDVAPTVVSSAGDQFVLPSPATEVSTHMAYVEPGDVVLAHLGFIAPSASPTNSFTAAALVNEDTGEVFDASASIVADLDETLASPFTQVRMGVVAYKTAKTFPAGRYRVRFTSTEGVRFGQQQIVVVRGSHDFETVHAQVTSNDASIGPVGVGVEISADRANQLGIVVSSTAVPGASIVGASPGTLLPDTYELYQGSSWWVAWSQYTTPDDSSPLSLTNTLSTVGEGGEIYLAVGFVFNPTEQGGMHKKEIYPVIECDVENQNTAKAITRDAVSEVSIEVQETQGESALDPLIAVGAAPTDFYDNHSDGIPILTDEVNWSGVEVGTFREIQRTSSGIKNQIIALGERPGASFSLPFIFFSREDMWRVKSFFDSRGGRLHPFWLSNPSAALKLNSIAVDNATLFFEPRVKETDWAFYKHYAVHDKQTGDTTIHSVAAGPVESGGQMIVQLSPALPNDNASRYTISTAHLCRLDSDAFIEAWYTDEANEIILKARELINEKTVEISLLDLCGTGGGPDWVPNDSFDTCQDYRCCVGGGECNFCGYDGVVLKSHCYHGECLIDECCPDEVGAACEYRGTCYLYLHFDSCNEGTSARWEGAYGTSAVVTCFGDWTIELGTWYATVGGCCDEVDQGPSSPQICCNCVSSPACTEPDIVIDETCSSYLRRQLCGGYEPNCIYVTVFEARIGGG